jgi:hypothetical protein
MDSLLATDRYFQWSWTHNGERAASIGVRVQAETVTLIYKGQTEAIHAAAPKA